MNQIHGYRCPIKIGNELPKAAVEGGFRVTKKSNDLKIASPPGDLSDFSPRRAFVRYVKQRDRGENSPARRLQIHSSLRAILRQRRRLQWARLFFERMAQTPSHRAVPRVRGCRQAAGPNRRIESMSSPPSSGSAAGSMFRSVFRRRSIRRNIFFSMIWPAS